MIQAEVCQCNSQSINCKKQVEFCWEDLVPRLSEIEFPQTNVEVFHSVQLGRQVTYSKPKLLLYHSKCNKTLYWFRFQEKVLVMELDGLKQRWPWKTKVVLSILIIRLAWILRGQHLRAAVSTAASQQESLSPGPFWMDCACFSCAIVWWLVVRLDDLA